MGHTHTEAKDEQHPAMGPNQSEQVFSDMVLWIHPLHVANMVRTLQERIADAGYPAFVLWSGLSGRCNMGVVVVEWEGEIAPSFLQDLRRDVAITDFVSYDWASAHRFYEEKPADEAPPLLVRFQTRLEDFRKHLAVVIDLRHIPQEQEIEALFQDFQTLRAMLLGLQPSSALAISCVEERADCMPPFAREVVLLRQTCQSEEQTLECVRSRQFRVRAEGQTFVRYAEGVQKQLEENR